MAQNHAAYEGSEPYIFISYSHKDTDTVMPVIRGLQEAGFRVWYDVGIELGYEWPDYIASHILAAHCMLFFVTQNAADSQYCRQEITYAAACRKAVISIYLEENVRLSPGTQMMLNNLQASLTHSDALLDELASARLLQPCLCPAGQDSVVSADAELQFRLGQCYYYGKGTAKDPYQAVGYYRRAAEAGYAPAMRRMGECCYFGTGILRDPDAAVGWYERAAALNDAAAQFRLGECYFLGTGYDRDYNQAFMWFRKAAAQGHEKADEYLKKYYYSGRIIRGEMQ